MQQRDYLRALAELRALERRYPRDPELYLRQAMVLQSVGRPDRAEKAARHALAIRPGYDEAREWLGEILLDQQRTHRALNLFEECLKRNPRSYFALVGKGRALEQLLLFRHPVAIPDLSRPVEKAVELNPGNPLGLLVLARMRLAYENRVDEAERLAQRAAGLDAQSAGPYILLAEAALRRPPTPENLRLAGQYAYEAGRRNLSDPRPPYHLGRVCLQQNDPDRAIKALERSIALGAMPEAVSQVAVAYRRAGNAERANYYAGIYQRWSDLMERRNALLSQFFRQPREVRHHYALASLYLEAAEPGAASRWLAEARRVRRSDPRGQRLLARARALMARGGRGPMLPVP
jgi:tetratricopeptide (TPR) repeat protein